MWLSLQIATQIAVLIAKVARLDCPRQWPELIPILVESVKVQDDLRQHRALLTFYHVTKTLASKRLAADRKLFYDVSINFSKDRSSSHVSRLVSLLLIPNNNVTIAPNEGHENLLSESSSNRKQSFNF